MYCLKQICFKQFDHIYLENMLYFFSYLLRMRQLITLNEIRHKRVKGHRYRLEWRGLYKSNSYLD